MHHALLPLAQAAHVRAAARASGFGGDPQADPPRVTSLTALTHAPGLPSGPFVVPAVPLPLTFLFRHETLERFLVISFSFL